MSKIILVGANHAGTAAINTILDNYNDHDVVIFEQNSNISFLGCGMALWIGNQIDGPEGLFYSSKEKIEAKGAKVYMETQVQNIDFDNKIITVRSVDDRVWTESYDKIILATGSVPISPKIPGVNLENVQFVKLYQDAQVAIERLKNPKINHVTVVGAGYIGVELAEAFERCGKKVTLIDATNTCLGKYFDEPFTKLMTENLKSKNIELLFNQKVLEIKGKDVVEAITTDRTEFATDMVVLAIGFNPNVSLGKGTIAQFSNGAFRVNLQQQTNVPDVYAIGDCSTIYDNAIEAPNYIALATNAVRSGIIAGHNACGTPLKSIGVQGSNGISIYGLNMVSSGLTLEMAKNAGFEALATDFEDFQRPEFMHKNEKVKIRIVYDKKSRRVLGTQIASKEDISLAIHLFSLAIEEKVTIDRLKLLDIFFLPHFNKPYNYITMAALNAK